MSPPVGLVPADRRTRHHLHQTTSGIVTGSPPLRGFGAPHAIPVTDGGACLRRCLQTGALSSPTPTPPPLPPNQRQGRLLRDSHSWGISAGVRYPPPACVAPPGAYQRDF